MVTSQSPVVPNAWTESKLKSWGKAGYSCPPLQQLCQQERLGLTSVVTENGIHVSKHLLSRKNTTALIDNSYSELIPYRNSDLPWRSGAHFVKYYSVVLPLLETERRGRQTRVLVRGKEILLAAFLFCLSISNHPRLSPFPMVETVREKTSLQNFIKFFSVSPVSNQVKIKIYNFLNGLPFAWFGMLFPV